MMRTPNSREHDPPGFAVLQAKFRSTLLCAFVIMSVCLGLAALPPIVGFAKIYPDLIGFFLSRQDLLLAAIFILVSRLPIWDNNASIKIDWIRPLATLRGFCIVAACLVGICWLGRHFVYLDYNLSRDEQMADFDAYVFAHGRLFWPLPKFWQIHAPALNQMFMLPIGDHVGWISAYLPINSVMRAAASHLVSSSLTSPILVAVGALSLWRITKRLWPNSPSTCAVALILYAGSAQIIFNGMTAYAMSGHLALDLVWLDLFLLNRRWSHLGAIIVGFLATGLHQPLFHPLFVLPFLGLLRSQRRWPTLAVYLTAYLLIGAFWFAWPSWISSHGMAHISPLDAGAANYLSRLIQAFHAPSTEAIWLTAVNLLRFVTWQHLILLPLMAVGIRTAWNQDPLARAITISFLLPIVVMLIVLPYQGHGWGYRYLHGVIGNSCLLACYGWAALESQGLSPHRALAWTSAATFLIFMPVRAAQVHQMVAPFATVSRVIADSPADFAIVENKAAPFGDDVVLNLPDLSNRPIRLLASELSASDIPKVCARGSIAFIEAPRLKQIAEFFGGHQIPTSQHALDLEKAARRIRCNIVSAR
jgi:hypothetical protein